LCQRNQSVGCIKRLRNRMALNAMAFAFLGHGSSSQGLVLPAAILL
jgi:hypothetical protein